MRKQLLKIVLTSLITVITFKANAQWDTLGSDIFNTNNGNVGIGTNYPLGKLHVNGDIYSSGTLHAGGIDIFNLTADSLRQVKDIKLVNGLCINGTTESRIYSNTSNLFLQNDPSFNYNTIINAINSGMVGIGTTNPTAKLDVNGTAKISSLASGNLRLVGVDAQGNLVSVSGGNMQAGDAGSFFIPMNWNTWGNDIVNGDYIGTNNTFDFVIKTDGSERGRVSTKGFVQWGTGAWITTMGQADGQDLGYGTGYLGFNASRDHYTETWTMKTDGLHNGGGAIWGSVTGQIYFAPIKHTGTSQQTLTDAGIMNNAAMTIDPEGRVGIGTSNPNLNFKLSVKGNIVAEEVQVALYQNWPDYVFDNKYNLMPLSELETYLKTNKHLPNIPSAQSMEEKGGISIGEIQTKQLEKTEELYLYIIELNKEIQLLKDKVVSLESQQ